MFVHFCLKFFNQFLPNFCTKYRKGNLRHLSSYRRLISLIFHTSSMTLFSFFSCSVGIIYNNSVESISRKNFTVEILNFLAKNSKACLLSWKRWEKIERNEDLVSQREWQFTPITTSHSSVRLYFYVMPSLNTRIVVSSLEWSFQADMRMDTSRLWSKMLKRANLRSGVPFVFVGSGKERLIPFVCC